MDNCNIHVPSIVIMVLKKSSNSAEAPHQYALRSKGKTPEQQNVDDIEDATIIHDDDAPILKLPNELLILIFELAARSLNGWDLRYNCKIAKSILYSCRRFYHLARPILYQEVSFYLGSRDMERFLRSLQENPTLCSLTKKMYLMFESCTDIDDEELQLAVEIRSLLSNMQLFEMECSRDAIIEDLYEFPDILGVTSLKLENLETDDTDNKSVLPENKVGAGTFTSLVLQHYHCGHDLFHIRELLKWPKELRHLEIVEGTASMNRTLLEEYNLAMLPHKETLVSIEISAVFSDDNYTIFDVRDFPNLRHLTLAALCLSTDEKSALALLAPQLQSFIYSFEINEPQSLIPFYEFDESRLQFIADLLRLAVQNKSTLSSVSVCFDPEDDLPFGGDLQDGSYVHPYIFIDDLRIEYEPLGINVIQDAFDDHWSREMLLKKLDEEREKFIKKRSSN